MPVHVMNYTLYRELAEVMFKASMIDALSFIYNSMLFRGGKDNILSALYLNSI